MVHQTTPALFVELSKRRALCQEKGIAPRERDSPKRKGMCQEEVITRETVIPRVKLVTLKELEAPEEVTMQKGVAEQEEESVAPLGQ